MSDHLKQAIMHHVRVKTPLDVASLVSTYAGGMPWPQEVSKEVYVAHVIQSLLTSPTTRKEAGFYSMMLPYPIWLLHEGTRSSEPHLTTVTNPELYPEGRYHGVLYLQLSNAKTKMDHSGKIVTAIGPEDTVEIGLQNMVLVTPYKAPPRRKRLLRRLIDAVEEQVRIFNEL